MLSRLETPRNFSFVRTVLSHGWCLLPPFRLGPDAAWLEFVDEHAEWRLRLVNEAGDRGPATTVARVTSSRSSGYPRIARQKDMLVLAWTDAGAEPPKISTATVRLR